MVEKPFFSIVLPTYNQSSFLKNCINSILKQTYENWELLIINNNSTDNTLKIINQFNDKRIRVLEIQNSGILAKSRNLGIKNSLSKWICFVDTDDTWYPEKLNEIKKYIYNTKGDLFYHDLVFENKRFFFLIRKKIQDKSRTINKPILEYFALNGNAIGNSSVVIKKSLLKSLNYISTKKDKFSWEDFDTWIRAAQKTKRFIRVPKVLGSIWVGTDNISSLERQITNSINIKKFYKKIFYKYINNKNQDLWWLEYPSILEDFRKKNITNCLKKINNITPPPFRIFLILNYIKFNLMIFALFKTFKKFFTIVIIFVNKIRNNYNHPSNKNYKIVKDKNSLKKIKFDNFKISKIFIDRINKNNYFHYIFIKNNLISYGWSSKSKKFLISEINSNMINKKNLIFYDFKTLTKYRRKGNYKLLLKLMLNTYRDKRCYIYTTLLNIKSLSAIFKSGFQFNSISTIYKKIKLFY